MKVLLGLGIVCSLALQGCSPEGFLVKEGESGFKIFVAPDAPAPEKFAAAELRKYLNQISGADIPVVETADPEDRLIYVGFRGAPEELRKGLEKDSPEEHYVIRSTGKALLIAGGGKRGTLYGVIGYLADHLGCRWYTREVTRIPSRATIPLPVFEDRQKPAFEYREAWYHEAYDTHWAVHNRLNPSIRPIPDSLGGSYITYPFAHTFAQLVPPSEYFQKHPEYFSEINGKRQAKDAQLCLTNPEVVRIASERVFQWIGEHPEANVFSVDQNDGEGNCECRNCRAIDEREGSPAGSLLHFVNQIADTVGKVFPDLKLQTFAYAYTEAPPRNIRPASNVTIRLCHYNYCSAHAMDGCAQHKPFRDRYEQWREISDRISVWDYFTDFSQYLMPYPNFESVIHNVKWYADKGAAGLFAQGNNVPENGGGEFSELRAWVLAQLMWKPDLDGWALINEFVRNVYGEAAPYIETYIRMLHQNAAADSSHFSIWAQPLEVGYLDPGTVARADSLFGLARQAVSADSALLNRVTLAYLPVLYTRLYFYSVGGEAYLKKDEMPAVFEEFRQIIRKNRITAMGDIPETYGNIGAFMEKVRTAPSFLTDWHVAGPFDNADSKGLQTVYAPEKGIDLDAVYEGKEGKTVRWVPYSNTSSGYIDFALLFEPAEYVVSYAYRRYPSETARKATFGVGSNDGVRVWINGKLVLDRPVSRKAEPNQDKIEVMLQKGDNHILVKVDQLKRAWGFYFTEL